MKFSHSLQFNAVPEWSSKYIAYSTLKKLIYQLQRESLRASANQDPEALLLYTHDQGGSVIGGGQNAATVFTAALDAELTKIDTFYKEKEQLFYAQIDLLIKDVESFEGNINRDSFEELDRERRSSRVSKSSRVSRRQLINLQQLINRYGSDASEAYGGITTTDHNDTHDEEDEDEEGMDASNTLSQTKSLDDYLQQPRENDAWRQLPPQLILLSEGRVILRKRVIELYTSINELKLFIELNQTGFKKACKKFDKLLNTNVKDDYLALLPDRLYIFQKETLAKVNELIEKLTKLFAIICNHEDIETARQELSVHLREHVVWERNTVWRDMIGLERKTYAANDGGQQTGDEKDTVNDSSILSIYTHSTFLLKLLAIIVIFVILMNVSILEDRQQQHCLALLVMALILWATETIPLFVTSLVIPIVIVSCAILKNEDGSPMDANLLSKYILLTMWNSVILLLLGGFTLAAALSKYNIAKLLLTWILLKAGTSPPVVLLTIMGVALFALMWISNVAAPVLCFLLIQPLLRTLPKGSQFTNALILGIALALNIGGMALPIASPQNIIAIGAMDPPPLWGQWFVVALPVCVVALVLIWIFLLALFNTRNTQLVPIRVIDDRFTATQWFISFISALTIFLWCISLRLEGIFGEMGIIALFPIVIFFGSGLLTTEDFNNYPWNIVILAMGGTALGKAVALSGLLATIALAIRKEVVSMSLFGVTLTFGLLILTMATFVSHTVAALIIIPLVAEIGNSLPDPHANLLIMTSALLCSAAMGLPTSGFPNVTAICMTDQFGKPYLTVNTFITRGVPSSIIAYVVIILIGYTTLRLIGF